jgi:hypothetical protein
MSYVTHDKIPDDNCAICQESLKYPTKAVVQFPGPCNHFFHNDCLDGLCNAKYHTIHNRDSQKNEVRCPLCKRPFDPYNYIISFLSKKYSRSKLYPFSENFRKGYKNAWINNIKDYTP